MPFFTLHRTHVLRTTKGHSVGFVKGERTWVPPACVPDAVAIGAVSEDGVDVIGEEAKPVVSMTNAERDEKMFAAFDLLMTRNERGDFTASGMPHTKKLEQVCGFEISNRERDTAWQAFLHGKSDGQ